MAFGCSVSFSPATRQIQTGECNLLVKEDNVNRGTSRFEMVRRIDLFQTFFAMFGRDDVVSKSLQHPTHHEACQSVYVSLMISRRTVVNCLPVVIDYQGIERTCAFTWGGWTVMRRGLQIRLSGG